MKKALQKVIFKSLEKEDMTIFKPLVFLYNERVEFDSDFAKLSFLLTWFIGEWDNIDITKVKQNYVELSKEVHKKIKGQIEADPKNPFTIIRKQLIKLNT